MAFNGSEGKVVTLATGAAYTAEYRTANPGAVKGQFVGKDLLKSILDQEGCMGIRIYYGLSGETKKVVLCGADAEENDMLEIIGDESLPCPAYCSSANSLNS